MDSGDPVPSDSTAERKERKEPSERKEKKERKKTSIDRSADAEIKKDKREKKERKHKESGERSSIDGTDNKPKKTINASEENVKMDLLVSPSPKEKTKHDEAAEKKAQEREEKKSRRRTVGSTSPSKDAERKVPTPQTSKEAITAQEFDKDELKSARRDGAFFRRLITEESKKKPKLKSDRVVMNPILKLRCIDNSSLIANISVLTITMGSSLSAKDIPLRVTPVSSENVTNESAVILPHKLLEYDGCVCWVHEIPLKQSEKDQEFNYDIGNGLIQRKFYLVGTQSFQGAFFSCNGRKRAHEEVALERAGGVSERWADLYQECTKKKVSVLVGMGDQIYQDMFEAFDEMKRFHSLDKNQQIKEPFTEAVDKEMRKLFFWKYLYHFSRPNFNDAMGSMLTLFVWDDHEIFDGFGSYSPELQFCPVYQGIFSIATWAYLLFQHQSTATYLSTELRPLESKMFFGKSFHSAYHFGKVSIINLDARSERSKTRIISNESYIELAKQLYRISDNCEHVIVVVTIPVVFPEVTSIVNAIDFIEDKLPKLYKKIPRDPLDDFVDHWRYRQHLEERKFLVQLLQESARSDYVRISIFSGDVHTGCIGKIRPEKPLAKEYEDSRVIYNVTTSGISCGYKEKSKYGLHALAVYNNALGDKIGPSRAEMIPFPWTSHMEKDKEAKERMFVARNNWMLVELKIDDLEIELRALPVLNEEGVKSKEKDRNELKLYRLMIPKLEWVDLKRHERVFLVEVITSDIPSAGSSHIEVLIDIFGQDDTTTGGCSTQKMEMLSSNPTPFAKGQKDIFKWTTLGIKGELTKARVRRFGAPLANWHLNRVNIIDEVNDESYQFIFNRWMENDLYYEKFSSRNCVSVACMEARDIRLTGPGYPLARAICGMETFSTEPVASTNPCWTRAYNSFNPVPYIGEEHSIAEKEVYTNLTVQIVEKNAILNSERLYGKVVIDLSQYPKGKVIDDWFEMTVDDGSGTSKPQEHHKEPEKKSGFSFFKKKSNTAAPKGLVMERKGVEGPAIIEGEGQSMYNIFTELKNMGMSVTDQEEVVALIRKKQRKPMIHLRIYYFAPQFPDIGLNQRLMFDEDLVANVKSGDVIAYCGVHWLSKVIQGKTDRPVSHLGIALRIKSYEWGNRKRLPNPLTEMNDDPKKEMVFVVESTSNISDKPDYFDDQVRKGVNIFSLSDRIRTIDSRGIWHFPLANPLSKDEHMKLLHYLKEQYDRGAKYDLGQMLALGIDFDNKEDLSSFFCSELVASALKSTGLVECNPSIMSPKDVLDLPVLMSHTPKMLSYI
eukprot:TRINITY_DN1409_c0_g1_i1.p1 TRINITY_DN1409_c0_g1~~TRINITY_DN1409_c0_g1_i1.p1  ORF type:complete len:1293 (-),score=399.08 TRINITY_DN1409_c0_g1_i1:43-3921(-)